MPHTQHEIVIEVLRDYVSINGCLVQYMRCRHGNLATVMKKDATFRPKSRHKGGCTPMVGIPAKPDKEELADNDKSLRRHLEKPFLFNKSGEAILKRADRPIKTDFPQGTQLQKVIAKRKWTERYPSAADIKTVPRFFVKTRDKDINYNGCSDAASPY